MEKIQKEFIVSFFGDNKINQELARILLNKIKNEGIETTKSLAEVAMVDIDHKTFQGSCKIIDEISSRQNAVVIVSTAFNEEIFGKEYKKVFIKKNVQLLQLPYKINILKQAINKCLQ